MARDSSDPDNAPAETSHTVTRPQRRGRRAFGLWAVLLAVIVGAVGAGAALFATGAFEPATESNVPRLAASGIVLAKTDPGTCLTWDGAAPSNIRPIDCAQPHTFEVAGTPERTFAPDAKFPTPAEAAALRDQVCPPVVNRYLGRQLDPKGRYQPGLLTADEPAWAGGDRTMRCGVQTVDGAGTAVPIAGRIVNQDKSTTWPAGTCIGIDARAQPTGPVQCAQPHAFEVTAVVDLRRPFPATSWPTTGQQEEYLGKQCPTATIAFFGAQDGLRKSGLQLQWNTLSQSAWAAGARGVICFLASSRDGRTFTPLTGSAKSADLLIDGKRPAMPTFPGAPPARPGG